MNRSLLEVASREISFSIPVTPLWFHEGINSWRQAILWILALLFLETLLETTSVRLRSAYGQTVDDTAKRSSLEKRGGDTTITPSLTMTERYDSNIFVAPQRFIPPGVKKWDFVSTVSPGVQFLNKNSQTQTELNAGVNGNLLVNNPELNFYSGYVNGSADLSGWMSELIRGTKLKISDAFQVTPEQPSFVSSAPIGSSDVFARGIQPVRARLYTNTAGVAGSYAVSRTVDVFGEYSFSILRVAEVFLPQPGTGISFFNTDAQRWSVGSSMRLARQDTVSLKYTNTSMSLSQFEGNETSTFRANGVEAGYVAQTPGWKLMLSGGGTVVLETNRAFVSGAASLQRGLGPDSLLQINASRQVSPSFFLGGAALISSTASVQFNHNLSKELILNGIANYSLNETNGITTSQTFTSYGASARLTYIIGPRVSTSVQYQYYYFDVNVPGRGYILNRDLVTFSLSGSWK
jgi:hypothetical protein